MIELLTIYTLSADGSTYSEFLVDGSPVEISEYSYVAERMGTTSLSGTVKHHRCLDALWTGREFVVLDEGALLQSGVSAVEKFFLLHVPSSRKDNTDERYEHTLDFRSARDILLSGVYFCDAVNPGAASAGKPVNNGYEVKFVGTLDEFVQRFNDVLAYLGLSSRFSVSLEAGVQGTTESLEIAFDRATLAEALARAYDVWGVPYYFVGDSAVFGSADSSPLVSVEYGHDKELLSVSMNNRGDKIVTRIAGEGGTENVPYYYPNPTPKGALSLGGTFAAGASISDALLFAQKVGTSDVLTYEGKDAAFGFIEVHFGGRTGHSAEGGVTAAVEDVEMASGTEYPLWVGVGADLSGGFDRSLRIPLYANVGCEEQVDPDTLLYYVTSHDPTGSYGGTYSFLTRKWGDVSAKGWDIVVDRAEAVFGTGANAVTVPVKWTEDYAEREVAPEDAELYAARTLSGVSVDLGAVIAQLPAGTDLQHVYVHVFGHLASKVMWQVNTGVTGSPFAPAGFLAERVSAVSSFDPCGWYLGDESFGEDLSELGLTVTGTPQEGDTLTQVVSRYVTPTGRIMPSIYRDSYGAARSYDADNTPPPAYAQAYVNPDTGVNYVFEHEYDALEPHEHVERFDDVSPSIKNLQDGQGNPLNVLDSVYFEPGYNVRDLLPDGETLKYQYFFVRLKALGFNLFDCAIENGEMEVVMSDGACAGCRFKIMVDQRGHNPVRVDGGVPSVDASDEQAAQQDTTSHAVWLALYLDDSTFGGGEYGTMPAYDQASGAGPKPVSGDAFTLGNILLPQAFFTAAEQELDRRSVGFMWKHNADKFDPSVIFSRVYLAQHPTVRNGLSERSRLSLTYDGRTFAPLYVSQFTMNVKKDEALPEILVETADAVEPRTAGLEDRIDEAVGKAVGVVRPAGGGVDFSEADKRYLRKDDEDTAKGKITFEKGLEIGKFQSGREGSGGAIYSNAAGEALAEVDYLLVRRKATFTQLEVEALRKVNGTILLSMADAVLTAVEQTNAGWKCWFKTAAEDGSAVENGFAAGDQAICRTLRSNKDHYYWRLVTAVGPDWIELSASDADAGSDAPEVGDTVVQLGNRSDAARQAAQILSCYGTDSPSYVIYAGINSYVLAGKEISGFVYRESTPGSGTYRPHFFNYGSMLLGDPSGDRVTFTPASGSTPGVLEVRGRVIVQGSEGGDVDLSYLTTALPLDEDATLVQGGLILSKTIALTDAQGNIKAGINGLTSLGDIAAWYGGPMVDHEAIPLASDYAKSLFRFDGSGYLAGGNIHWNSNGYGGIPGITWSRPEGSQEDVITIGGNVKLASVDGDDVTDLINTVRDLMVLFDWFEEVNLGTNADPAWALRLKRKTAGLDSFDRAFVSYGDQVVLGGTPGSGGGGGGGASYLHELLDVDNALVSPAADAVLQYDAVAHLWKGNAPATQIGANVTGLVTGSLLQSILGDEAWDATNTVKKFINSSIATATATYRGNYNEYSDLGLNPSATRAQIATKLGQEISGADDNDYCFVEIPTSTSDPTQIERTERYKYDGTSWAYEYTLNNSGFTAAQWAAINSGVTGAKVSAYDTVAGYFSNGVLGTSHLPALYLGTTQIQTASAQQDVTGIGQLTMGYQKYLRMLDDDGNAVNVMRTSVSNSVLYLQIGSGLSGRADAATYIYGGRGVRITTGRSSGTTHLDLTENDGGVKGAVLHGNLVMDNAAYLSLYNKPAEGAQAQTVTAMRLTAGNEFRVGEGTIAKDYATKVYGSPFYILTGSGSSSPIRLQVTADGIIKPYGDIVPNSNNAYDLGSASAFFAEAYAKKLYLAAGIYIEYDSTNGYVHINAPLVTDGDQIVTGGTPGGGGTGGATWLNDLSDVTITTPASGNLLRYDGTKWTNVASSEVGVTTAGTVAELNSSSPTNDKRVWSPSVLSSWLAGKNYVQNVAIGTGDNSDTLAVTRGGSTSYLTIPYATTTQGFKRIAGTAAEGGYDLNTLLSGGGVTGNYSSTGYWANGPANMSYGGAMQVNCRSSESDLLAMQLAWDIKNNQQETGKLWWRDRGIVSSTQTPWWGSWHLIYDDSTLTKSVLTDLLDAGAGTYVKRVGDSMSGDLTLANNKNINALDTASSARSLLYLSNSNNVVVGGGTRDMATGGATYIDGKTIRLYTPNANNAWTVAMLVNGNQNVTIGATDLAADDYKLYVNGDTYIKGIIVTTGDQVVTSDIRVKRNIKPIDLSVEQIASCRAVTFDWASGGHSFGSIAQDWEPILPEAVKDGDVKALAYGQLALVAAINLAKHETAQDKEIRVLKDALGKANGRIEALEKEVKLLRAN